MADREPTDAPGDDPGSDADLLPGVDLLPDSHRLRRNARRVTAWRAAAAVCCAGLLAAGVVGGELRLARLERLRDDARGRAAALPTVEAEVARLRGETARRARGRRVAAALRLSPSPTRLLAGVAAVLPERARLGELRLRTVLAPVGVDPAGRRRSRGAADDAPLPPPAAADLARLTEDADRVRHELELTGTVEDDLALTRLLTGLRSDGCFAETRLIFADVDDAGPARGVVDGTAVGTRRRRFAVGLVLRRPGEYRVGPRPADLPAERPVADRSGGAPPAAPPRRGSPPPGPSPDPVPSPDPLDGPVAVRPAPRL